LVDFTRLNQECLSGLIGGSRTSFMFKDEGPF
jgi:hypothetical protein